MKQEPEPKEVDLWQFWTTRQHSASTIVVSKRLLTVQSEPLMRWSPTPERRASSTTTSAMQCFHVMMMPLSTPRQPYGMLPDVDAFHAWGSPAPLVVPSDPFNQDHLTRGRFET
jgi:hypothetical protein